MPRRSNLFQDVVAIIHTHMAEGATVAESAELVNRATGRKREVDVVITSETAGHTVTVSVEASAPKRAASVEWVERMIGKHADLPTDKLVLVSESGFRPQAREYADAKGVLAIAPDDLAAEDAAYRIVNRLQSIWPKTIALQPPKEVSLVVSRTSRGDEALVKTQPNNIVYLDDGQEIGTLGEIIPAIIEANRERMFEQLMPELRDIAEDATRTYALQLGPEWAIQIDGKDRRLCVRDESGDEPELHMIETVRILGDAVIHVSEVSLAHQRLGAVSYSYGEGTIGGTEALVVITENDAGGKATFRLRPQKSDS